MGIVRRRTGFSGTAGRFRRAAGWLLAAAALALNFSPQVQSLRNLPEEIQLPSNGSSEFQLFLPVRIEARGESAQVAGSQDERLKDLGLTSELSLSSAKAGQTDLTIKLLGLIPVKRVQVTVYPERMLIPGGEAIGVAIKTRGVLVVGLADVDGSSARSPARDAGLAPGDVIEALDGIPLQGASHLTRALSEHQGGSVRLSVKRGGTDMDVLLTPERDRTDGAARIGAWVRDSTAGVGTLSFYDPSTNKFGALGHAITDADTGTLLSVGDGKVFYSDIVDIRIGQKGEPGELRGVFPASPKTLGVITNNTEFGIYGTATGGMPSTLYPQGLPIGTQAGVHTGPASILTTLDDTGVHEYACEIVHVSRQGAPASRSMVVQITDEQLLQRTGGIVQGMSGSPIIQDGHIVGAVTHVYVNDPTRGYGLFIEWMLQSAN